jgi:hypothetical protein
VQQNKRWALAPAAFLRYNRRYFGLFPQPARHGSKSAPPGVFLNPRAGQSVGFERLLAAEGSDLRPAQANARISTTVTPRDFAAIPEKLTVKVAESGV